MPRGDNVYVRRRHYSHHGVDCGDGSVIHFMRVRRRRRVVARTSMAEFAGGSRVHVRVHQQRLDPDQAVLNAESRLGAVDYHLVRNNCEHFVRWACTGRASSGQVRRWAFATHGGVASLAVVQASGAYLLLLGAMSAWLLTQMRPRRRREVTLHS
jgi:hypothetical protein